MAAVKSSGTGVELTLQQELVKLGSKFQTDVRVLPGKPDLVLDDQKVAVFIDGDFWHGGQWRRRHLTSLDQQFEKSTDKSYWVEKIERNIARDFRVTETLLDDGWTVLRLWESHVVKDPEACARMAAGALTQACENESVSFSPRRTVAEFFAGIGLVRMGLESAGWKVQFANDIDSQKHEMYSANFPTDHFDLADIRSLRGEQIPRVTLATASFPCNDLSVAGARAGLSGRLSSTYWEFLRILTEMAKEKPPIVLIENVVGFLTSHGGQDLETALEGLNRLGYSVDMFAVDASHFVPQSRLRLFIVGSLDLGRTRPHDLTSFGLGSGDARPKEVASFIAAHPRLRWAIRPLPSLPVRTTSLEDVLDKPPFDSTEWWDTKRAKYLLDQMSDRNREKAEKMIRGNSVTYGTVFRRIRNQRSMAELRTDGIAGCLRTPRGGSARQILFAAGKGEYRARLLNGNECARLMGADSYRVDVPLNQALFGFGDAVCAPVVSWIARHYLTPLASDLMRGNPLKVIPAS
jgi:DNA (cytosine-5)-methyltransferase 1